MLQKKHDENSKPKFSEYIQNISMSKSFGKFVLIVVESQVSGNHFSRNCASWGKVPTLGVSSSLVSRYCEGYSLGSTWGP